MNEEYEHKGFGKDIIFCGAFLRCSFCSLLILFYLAFISMVLGLWIVDSGIM